uniref:AP-2 complex subunit mu n=1 Tax=Rhizophora mucronata TaxID=61149 RepID=A0A2P2JWW7_RHIMU
MRIFPVTSQRRTLPFEDIRRFTLSTISRKTSFFL